MVMIDELERIELGIRVRFALRRADVERQNDLAANGVLVARLRVTSLLALTGSAGAALEDRWCRERGTGAYTDPLLSAGDLDSLAGQLRLLDAEQVAEWATLAGAKFPKTKRERSTRRGPGPDTRTERGHGADRPVGAPAPGDRPG